MIWASDAEGHATFVSPEWTALTGQPRDKAEGWGWLEMIHPADRDTARTILTDASRAAAAFTMQFRVRDAAGDHIWVTSGAMPSFSRQDGRFLGFLGSHSETAPPVPEKAQGRVGLYNPPTSGTAGRPNSALEAIADHLLLARAAAAEAGEDMIRSIIDMCLLETGQRLASSQGPAPSGG